MPVKLIAPVYRTITMDEIDRIYENKGEPTTIIVKQARQHEHEQRQELFKRWEQIVTSLPKDSDQVHIIQDLSYAAVWREEAWLTLVSCNMLDENGEVLFPSGKDKKGHPELLMSRQAFDDAWGQLFPDMVAEIVKKIHTVNPMWGGALGEGR